MLDDCLASFFCELAVLLCVLYSSTDSKSSKSFKKSQKFLKKFCGRLTYIVAQISSTLAVRRYNNLAYNTIK